ncbi:MAG: tRNA (adenosine(37)-N6)-dimethylallyltransferase MiaA [Candidatus Pacebacteria bacterium]|nr:tRNA (adenosine(37)-N6)-dimethylallyltransferase MiaA [Candidatus Paceibacterota bacterium]
MPNLKPLVVILGPTASGKTGLALKLAKEFYGELINADSRQIYKEMDIATNKLEKNATRDTVEDEIVYIIDKISLHLLDLINPNENFSLADYKRLALQKIEEVQNHGKLPILVGGTGLYISSIVDNLDIPEAPPDKKLRAELGDKSTKELFNELQNVDPLSAKTIGPDNKRKIIRALEVYKITGKPFSAQQKKGKPLFDILQIGIEIERKELYAKIDKRVDKMIEAGLIDETKRLTKRYNPDLPAMSGIGYKEINSYLRQEITLEEAIQQIKWRTHQYARRQITWFKRDERIHWVKNYKEAEELIKNFIK